MFIDIHTHILHGVDDGPSSLQESVDMLELAASRGIRIAVATPHVLDGLQSEESIVSRFRELTVIIVRDRIEIDLFLASEIQFQFCMDTILVYTLLQSQYSNAMYPQKQLSEPLNLCHFFFVFLATGSEGVQ